MKLNKKSSPSNTDPEPALPPISAQMQKFMDKTFTPHPGRWFYRCDQFEADIDAQLVARGLVVWEPTMLDGKQVRRYRLAQTQPE